MIDLTVAIEIGIVLAAFLFLRKMIQTTSVNVLAGQGETDEQSDAALNRYKFPKGVEVFEITGPLFFGAAYKFKDAMRIIEKPPKVLIIRMGRVPIIDATGIKVMQEVYRECQQQHIKLILSEVHNAQVLEALRDARLLFAIGKANVTETLDKALTRGAFLLAQS